MDNHNSSCLTGISYTDYLQQASTTGVDGYK